MRRFPQKLEWSDVAQIVKLGGFFNKISRTSRICFCIAKMLKMINKKLWCCLNIWASLQIFRRRCLHVFSQACFLRPTCLWLAHNLFMTCSILVHYLLITYSQLVHTLFVTCSGVVNDLFTTCLCLIETKWLMWYLNPTCDYQWIIFAFITIFIAHFVSASL